VGRRPEITHRALPRGGAGHPLPFWLENRAALAAAASLGRGTGGESGLVATSLFRVNARPTKPIAIKIAPPIISQSGNSIDESKPIYFPFALARCISTSAEESHPLNSLAPLATILKDVFTFGIGGACLKPHCLFAYDAVQKTDERALIVVRMKLATHLALRFQPELDRTVWDPNLRSEGSLIPSVKARWPTALSLRQRCFEIAAAASPEAAAARS
jgi:hypothetical protein